MFLCIYHKNRCVFSVDIYETKVYNIGRKIKRAQSIPLYIEKCPYCSKILRRTSGGNMKPQIVNTRMNRLVKQSKLIKAVLFVTTIMIVAMMSGSLYFRDRVYITDNGVTRELMTSETNVSAILSYGEYTIGEHDRVSYRTEDENTAYITIQRAFDVNIRADGKIFTVPAIDETVQQMLNIAGITLSEHDIINCDLNDTATEGMIVEITRVNYQLRANTAEIPYETVYIDNSNMVIGDEKIVTQGENGVRTYVVKEKYVDGVLVGQELSSDNITKESVTMVIERGTALAEPYAKMDDPSKLTLVNGLPDEYTRIVSGKATAYTAGYTAKTASGRKAEIGTVAVNPNVIPYGSELYIVAQDGSKAYGYAIAADTGIALMDGTVAVDLYFGNKYDHYYDSCRWGAVQVDIYVLSEGEGY